MYNNYYQPYQGYPQFQNNPYINNYGNQSYNQNTVSNQQEILQGCIVDSVDVVKGRNCNLDGSATYYPLADKSKIYCKQLNANTGASMMLEYQLVQSDAKDCNKQISIENIVPMINNLNNEFSELKNIILDNLTSPKGGENK